MTVTPEELFEKNMNLVHWVLHNRFPSFAFDEDMQQEGMLGLWKGCLAYDEAVSKPSTFLTRCIQNSVLIALRKEKKEPGTVPLSELEEVGVFFKATDGTEEEFARIELEEMLEYLPERDKQLLNLVLQEKRQVEIAAELGVSQPYVSRRIKGLQNKLRGVK